MRYSSFVCFFFCSLILVVKCEAANGKVTCVRSVFKDTISELTEISELQLESIQNWTPETKKKVKTAIMDVLSSLGLVLEVSTVPTISLGMLPVFILRAKSLFNLLERDVKSLRPETENLSNSFEPIRKGVMTVIQGMPMKALMCFHSSEL